MSMTKKKRTNKSTVVNPNEKRQAIKQQLAKMADTKAALDLYYLIKSRCRISYVVSPEEVRVIQILRMITRSEGYDLFRWDCHNGLCDITASEDILGRQVADVGNEIHKMPIPLMDHLMECARNDNIRMNNDEDLRNEGKVYVLLDFHPYMQMNNPVLNRVIKDFAMTDSARHIVIVSPRFDCPDTLDKVISVLDYPYPSKNELKMSLLNIKKDIIGLYPDAEAEASRRENDILDAAAGMTLYEAENAFALSVTRKKTFDIPTILNEKRQVIRKNGILDYVETSLTFDDVGGLDALKEWFAKRKNSFTPEARKYGLPMSKGVMLAGMPGTGKSLTCEALANYWERPLLRMDMGAIFNSHIGQSESNVRQAIKTAEAVAPCIHPDTEVVVNDSKTNISDYFDREVLNSENNISTFDEKGKEVQKIVYLNNEQYISGVTKKAEPVKLRVKAIIRTRKKEKLIKITTDSGKEIITTKDHLLMDDKKNMKKSKEFVIGNSISCIYDNNIQGAKAYGQKTELSEI